ncbi:MAG: sulfite exporter TauE/SafE family protein [Haloferacaceae archaeon]
MTGAGVVLQTGGQCVAPGTQPTARSVELGLFFLIGLFGTGHCLGMCGPLVSLYADRMPAAERGDRLTGYHVRQHLLFNAGRTTIYALLGGAFGLFGALMFTTADTTLPFSDEIRGVTGIIVGAAIVVVGTSYVTGRGGGALSGPLPVVGRLFARVHDVLSARIDGWVGDERIFALGFVHGFLPCPLLYPAFLYAFSQADPVRGATSLALLGAGTIPALLLYGTVFQSVSRRYRTLVHRLLGVAFVLLGTHTATMGLTLLGYEVPHVFSLPFYQPLV